MEQEVTGTHPYVMLSRLARLMYWKVNLGAPSLCFSRSDGYNIGGMVCATSIPRIHIKWGRVLWTCRWPLWMNLLCAQDIVSLSKVTSKVCIDRMDLMKRRNNTASKHRIKNRLL